MSDTIETTNLPPIPNFSVTPSTTKFSGVDVAVTEVKFGDPIRTVVIRELDMGDTFDLAEIAGENAANQLWMNLATVAASVVSIDGMPRPMGSFKKVDLRHRLKDLGPLGVRAVGEALSPSEVKTVADVDAAAGNS